jgi:hypothetical protein
VGSVEQGYAMNEALPVIVRLPTGDYRNVCARCYNREDGSFRRWKLMMLLRAVPVQQMRFRPLPRQTQDQKHTGLSMTENYQKTDIPVGAMNKQEIPVRRICSTCDEIVEDPQVHLTVVDCPLDREHCQEQYKDKRGEVDYVKSDAVTYQIVNTYHGVLLLRCFHTAKPASKK